MRLGIIARADLTGLGVQSRNWVRLLDPQKLIVIDSTPFNHNEQHLEWYNGRGGVIVNGFIKPNEINAVLNNIDTLLTFEIPYSYELIRAARQRGVRTIIQNNWEFTDYLLQPHLPLPDLLVNHSYWHLDDQKKLWPEITDYCPTPVFLEDYSVIREQNMARSGTRRFLHVAGRKTYEDRNGTNDLVKAISLIPPEYDFELVLKTQNTEIPPFTDPRIKLDPSIPLDEKELYRGFDAMIMPRRYGGASLPMTEALASALPVIMLNVSPNNIVLPKDWLVMGRPNGSFMTRTEIDLYNADQNELADKIIDLSTISDKNMLSQKKLAYDIALKEYSSETVKTKWTGLMSKLGL